MTGQFYETRLLEEIHADLKVVRGLLEKQQARQDESDRQNAILAEKAELVRQQYESFVEQANSRASQILEEHRSL